MLPLLMAKKYYKYSNTRQSLRVPSSFLIKCKLAETSDDERFIIATTKDISGAGVSFIAKEELPLLANVELEIGFPNTPYPIKATGKIVRLDQAKGHQLYKIAVQFLRIDIEDREVIEEYVKRAIGRRPPRKSWWRKFA
jgi:c-di-GMP-binding flagellar brake protein YcgR